MKVNLKNLVKYAAYEDKDKVGKKDVIIHLY